MNLLVLIDSQRQASFVAAHPEYRRATVVAFTAEACQALDECGVSYEPISAVVDLAPVREVESQYIRDCLALARKIERFVAERDRSVTSGGPGFLSGQIYHLQYSFGAILTRAFLAAAAVGARGATHVRLFTEGVDPWFAGNGYEQNPWIKPLVGCLASRGISAGIDVLPKSIAALPTAALFARSDLRAWLKRWLGRLAWVQRRLAARRLQGYFDIPASPEIAGLRMLVSGNDGYDWGPVLAAATMRDDVECHVIRKVANDSVGFRTHYAACLQRLPDYRKSLALNTPPPDFHRGERYVDLFDEFVRSGGMNDVPRYLGIDVAAGVAPLLRALTVIGPELVAHADAVADETLEFVKPQVVCFTTIADVVDRCFAQRCRERGIPVVCYQHGGSYGTHSLPSHGTMDASEVDFFLTYGSGILPVEEPALPTRALHMPVGSSRIHEMQKRVSALAPSASVRVLWVAELSYRNTVAATHIVEDTTRFMLQRECLSILATAKNMRVVYRPFPFDNDWQATPRWLSLMRFGSIAVDASTSMASLIAAADVVVIDSAGSTVWNEVLALGKPLVLYCDPQQTPLRRHFADDLEHACRWYKTRAQFVDAMCALADNPRAFIAGITAPGCAQFLARYVLHEGDCVARTLAFLGGLRASPGQAQSAHRSKEYRHGRAH